MDDNTYRDTDEITAKELIVKIKEFVDEIKSRWIIVFGITAICLAGYMYQHFNHVPKYDVQLRFVVEGQNGGGGLNSLLGSFGIKKGGKVNPYKIIEVGKSSNILLDVLSQKMTDGEIMANAILKEYDLNEKWGKTNPDFLDFKFVSKVEINKDDLQNSVIRRLRNIIWGTKKSKNPPLVAFSLNDETGIYSLESSTLSEGLSLELTEKLYAKIKKFFEDEVFLNQKQLADILTAKADSIRVLNVSKINELAKFEDRNRGTVNNVALVRKKVLSQENIALIAAYAEVMKNKEMTDVNLKDMQPLFMSIDTPYGPLSASKSSLVIAIMKGLVLGLFLSFIIIVFRKIYNDIMSD